MSWAVVAGLIGSFAALLTSMGGVYVAVTSSRRANRERAEADKAAQAARDADDENRELRFQEALAAARLQSREELESLVAIQRTIIGDQEARHRADIHDCREDCTHLRERVVILEQQVRSLGGTP